MEPPIFSLVQKLLDVDAPLRPSVEAILGQTLAPFHGSDESERHFDHFAATSEHGCFRRFELEVPKGRGGVAMNLLLRERPRREAILQRFGNRKSPDYQSGGRTMLVQTYKGQTLLWVLDKTGSAERVLIQAGR